LQFPSAREGRLGGDKRIALIRAVPVSIADGYNCSFRMDLIYG
jgi:hypothetical protein